MKYKNKTKYNSEVLRRFNEYHLNHSVMTVFINTFAAVFALVMLYNYILSRDLSHLLFCLIFILFTGATKFVNSIVVKYRLKKQKEKETENYYEFYDDHIRYNNKNIKYNEFKKIKINQIYGYLYVDKNNAYIVDATKQEELIKFLKEIKKQFRK